MKASLLGLAIATAAFGASTIYLSVQLKEERGVADKLIEESRGLNLRIAELERVRLELLGRRDVPRGPFAANGAMTSPRPASTDAASPPPRSATGDAARDPGPFKRPEMPASMLKIFKNQMRARNEKTYFDLKEKLGLTDEETSKLLDLITDQQTSGMQRMEEGDSPDARAERIAAAGRKEAEIAELLGPTKLAQFEEYQKSVPARMEVQMLAQQFESSDAPLSEDQRSRLITAMSEERTSVAQPDFSNAASNEQYRKDYAAWQSDYEERATERARSILTSEQIKVYDDYRQFQKEMRAQRAARQGSGARGATVEMQVAPGIEDAGRRERLR